MKRLFAKTSNELVFKPVTKKYYFNYITEF